MELTKPQKKLKEGGQLCFNIMTGKYVLTVDYVDEEIPQSTVKPLLMNKILDYSYGFLQLTELGKK